MKFYSRIGQRGVTLVELVIVMGLLSIFLLIISTIFTSSLDVENQTNSYNAVTTDGRFIMARLDYDIARASAVTTPTTLGSTASTLDLTVGGNAYSYALSGGDLQLSDPTGTDDLNGSGTTVSALSFQRIGNPGGTDTVRYSFTLTGTNQAAGGNTQTFTSTAGLR